MSQLIPEMQNVELFRDQRNEREAAVVAGKHVTINVYASPDAPNLTLDNFDDQDDAIAAANRYLDTGAV